MDCHLLLSQTSLFKTHKSALLLSQYLTIIIIRQKQISEYICGIIPEANYSTIFTEPEENNYCFSIIAQVIIKAIAFSFILFVYSSKTSRNRAAVILKVSASVL